MNRSTLRTSIGPAVILAFAACALPAAATTYTLEPNYTQVVFRWNHLGFSHPAAYLAQGQGTLDYDAMDVTRSRVNVSLPLSALSTGVPDLDEHLKSGDFFAADRYPAVTFASTKVAQGMRPNELNVTGTLTIRDVSKPVTLEVTLLGAGENERTHIATMGFSARAKVKRSEFGLGAFVPQVGDEVEIVLTTQGAEARAYADYLRKQEKK
jgi:polyisoprenoid-binding protein YceI